MKNLISNLIMIILMAILCSEFVYFANKIAERSYIAGCTQGAVYACSYNSSSCSDTLKIVNASTATCKVIGAGLSK